MASEGPGLFEQAWGKVCGVLRAGRVRHHAQIQSSLRTPGPRWTAQLTLNGHTPQTKEGAGWATETFTDACAAIENSFRGDGNAAHFFTDTGDALADTWGDFKSSLTPIYDMADISVRTTLPTSMSAHGAVTKIRKQMRTWHTRSLLDLLPLPLALLSLSP
jgi:hypothetical protein